MKHQNVHHFGDKHLLIPLYLDAGDELYCKACELLIVEPFHGCLSCNYFLHHHCLNIPRSILHPSHPPHPLTLFPVFTYPSASVCCNACRQSGIGFTYSCAHCEFDIHLKCARLPEKLMLLNKHTRHELKLQFDFNQTPNSSSDNVIFECDMCSGVVDKDQWRYYCGDCDFGVLVGCCTEADLEDHDHLVEGVGEGRSGTAPLSTQPSAAAEVVVGGGGRGIDEQLDSCRQLSKQMIESQFELARIQNQVNLSAAAANIGRYRRYY